MLARQGKTIKLAALLAVFLVSAGPAWAQQAGPCPPSRTPIKLNFKTLQPQPVHNHRLTLQGIGNVARSQGAPQPPGQRILGLTVLNSAVGVQGASTAVKRGNSFCVYLTSVDVDFGWQRIEVYIPSEFARGSCQYNTVLDHENQHVALSRTALREYAPRARARIEAFLSAYRPVSVARPEGSAEAALAGVQTALSGILKEFQVLHAQRNAGIDSPANYKALSAMCKDWSGALP